MKKYLYQNKIYQFETELPQSYSVGSTIAEQHDKFIPLTPAMEAKWLNSQTAHQSAELTPEQRRQLEYTRRIPRELIDAFTTYRAEGNELKAAQIAAQIKIIKDKVREEIPEMLMDVENLEHYGIIS